MKTHVSKRRGLVAALGLALTAALGFGLAGPASADPVEDNTPAVGNIDTTKTGSLTITKLDGSMSTEAATGEELSAAELTGHNPLAGAEFTIYQIKNGEAALDLTVPENWKTLDGLPDTFADVAAVDTALTTAGLTKAPYTAAGTNGVVTTGADGKVAVHNMPLAAYVVVETKAPEGVSSFAAPFILTLPYPNANAENAVGGWLYDVNVYPKNQKFEIPEKTIAENTPTVNVGTDLKYHVTGTVPMPKTQGEKLTGYRFKDVLVEHLTFKSVDSFAIGGNTLEKDTDFTINYEDQTRTVTLTLTNTGLTKVDGGDAVSLDFTTTVVSLPENHGTIQNPNYDFEVQEPDGDGDWEGSPEPPVIPEAYFGDFQFEKVSSAGKVKLAGAEFQVYSRSTEDGVVADSVVKGTDGNPVTYISGENGLVNITGLYYGDSSSDSKVYYLVETKAPAGFKEPVYTAEDPLEFTVSADSTSATVDQQIENEPYDDTEVPDLPLTGAQGKLLMTLGGLAVIGVGVGTVMATRRKKA